MSNEQSPQRYPSGPYGQPNGQQASWNGQYAPQQGYPQHVVVGYQPAPPRGLSIASMVLGLVSVFAGFTFVVPIIGFILGIVGLRKEPAGRGMAVTGLILNGLFVLGWAILVIFVLGIGFLGIASVSTSTT
ncbi:DUF4190 domain-containing protein [Frigoribacterium sp. 2-23]|uniref:DUF4190 domain-containing protein n=1 Tax=Frigoribacterium sp. 2-23 TaxID=3415006 RepID=UPI003C6F1F75